MRLRAGWWPAGCISVSGGSENTATGAVIQDGSVIFVTCAGSAARWKRFSMAPLRLVVLGNLAGEPFPGTAWQGVQYVIGLCRMGPDVCYFETSSPWPYDPVRQSRGNDSQHTLPYLAQIAGEVGLQSREAYPPDQS